DAVRLGGGGGQQGECGGEQDAEGGGAAPGGAGEAHEGRSVAVRTCPRRPRSTRSATPCASCPRPAWAAGAVAPGDVGASAGCGSATVRPSAEAEAAYTATGAAVRTEITQAARCRGPKSSAAVPFAASGRGIRSLRPARRSLSKRAARAVM